MLCVLLVYHYGMVKRYISCLGFGILLFLSSLTFLYNRAQASILTVRQLQTPTQLNTGYTLHDSFETINIVVAQHPNYPIYFISDSRQPDVTGSSWQMIQTNYVTYPRTPLNISHRKDETLITNLATNKAPSIIVSLFKQEEFAHVGQELHPSSEYYIYILSTN